jgi:hypothetical protein
MSTALIYVGHGATFPDAPPRDLSTDDLQAIADALSRDAGAVQTELLASGVYVITDDPAPDAIFSTAVTRSGVVVVTASDSVAIVFARVMPNADYQVLLSSADAPDGLGAWITNQTTAGCTVNLPDVATVTIDYLAIGEAS